MGVMEEDFELSEVALKAGIKTRWECWGKNTFFNEANAILEICRRIEKIEESIGRSK